jgi:hypothetical protein
MIMPMEHIDMRAHEHAFLLAELESLGLRSIQLNEFNDNYELHDLIDVIKKSLLREYRRIV